MNDRRNFLSRFSEFPVTAVFVCSLLFVFASATRATDPSGKMDFDGDGKTDIAVFRPGQRSVYPLPPSYFYALGSRNGQLISRQWGRSYDIHTPADYDGDGKTDFGIFRWVDDDLTATAGHFWINYTLTGGHTATQVGGFGNIISRNYFNDPKAEIGVFSRYNVSEDPAEPCFIHAFSIKTEGSDFALRKDVTNECHMPQTYITPAVADYNADGLSDLAIFEQNSASSAERRFKIWHSPVSPIYTAPEIVIPFDIDYPIPGDYDGDGIGELAGSRNVNGVRLWRIRRSTSGFVYEMYFGFSNDHPVPGDYDGDGKTDIAVWRPSNGVWYIIRSSDAALLQIAFGSPTDIPLTMPNSSIYF